MGKKREAWEAEFRRRIVSVLLSEGRPVALDSENRGRFDGWTSKNWRELEEHAAQDLDPENCTWDETGWSEYGNTFNPGIEYTGMNLTVACKCGLITGREWRYSGGYADLIRRITDARP